MIQIKRVVLDILKPHLPDALTFSSELAACGQGYRVKLAVEEMDEKTETLKVELEAWHIDFEKVQEAINQMGASLHSIDEVEVVNQADTPEQSG